MPGPVCQAFIEKEISLQWSCYAHPRLYSAAPLARGNEKAGCNGGGIWQPIPALLRFWPDWEEKLSLRRTSARATLYRPGRRDWRYATVSPWETRRNGRNLGRDFSGLMEENLSPTAMIAMIGLRFFPGTGLARRLRPRAWLPTVTRFSGTLCSTSPRRCETGVVEIRPPRAGPFIPTGSLPGLSTTSLSVSSSKLAGNSESKGPSLGNI